VVSFAVSHCVPELPPRSPCPRPVSPFRRDFGSRLDEEAPYPEPPGKRLFDEFPPKVEERRSAMLVMKCAELVLDACGLTSSGGGEPDEGVERDGEPGSGGEFILSVVWKN
jgi:hypothetical protein